MMAHEIGVTAVEACIPVVGRWSDAEGLLSQRIRVLVFKRKANPSVKRLSAPSWTWLEMVFLPD